MIVSFAGCQTIENITGGDEEDKSEERELSRQDQQHIDNLFFDAQKQKIIGNPDRAAEKFREIINIYPGMDVAHYELALIYYKNENDEEALYHIERAVEADQTSNNWYKELYAQILEVTGDYQKAADIYTELIEKRPGRKSYYEDAVQMLIEAGEFEKALEITGQLESRFGESPQIGFNRYQIYLRMRENEKAVQEVEKMIDKNPGDVRFLELLANTYRRNNNPEQAYDVYHRILEDHPNHLSSQVALLDYYQRNNQHEKLPELTEKIIANPEAEMDQKVQIYYETFLSRGPENLPEPEVAIEQAKALTDLYPDAAETRSLYGDVLYQFDKLENAQEQYLKSVEIQSDVFPVWQNLFFISLELNDFEKLKEITSEAEIYFPNQPEVFYFSGIAHRELDEFETSIDKLETAAGLIVDNNEFRSEIYGQIADTWYMLDEFEKMTENFERALDLNPENAVALNNYSYYLALKNQNLDKAKEMSGKSLELSPENPAYLDTYGWILFRMGKYEEAEEWISKAIEIDPESKEIIDHYGDVQYKLGNTDEALKYWEKAHSLSDNSQEIKEKIEQQTIVNE